MNIFIVKSNFNFMKSMQELYETLQRGASAMSQNTGENEKELAFKMIREAVYALRYITHLHPLLDQ